MKKILYIAIAAVIFSALYSCDNESKSNWELFSAWRELNQNWLEEQLSMTNADGTPFYSKVTMPTNPNVYLYMHSIGDINSGNLKPLYTSTTKVNYTLRLCNDSIMDKGTNFESQLNSSSLITGWSLAIMQLNVGDSARFVIPYALGYGEYGTTSIPPYSDLVFDIKLVDITGYETRP